MSKELKTELRKFIEHTDLRFKSGNDVPVRDIRIEHKDWVFIKRNLTGAKPSLLPDGWKVERSKGGGFILTEPVAGGYLTEPVWDERLHLLLDAMLKQGGE